MPTFSSTDLNFVLEGIPSNIMATSMCQPARPVAAYGCQSRRAPPMIQREPGPEFRVAHVQELASLSPSALDMTAHARSMQHVAWHPVPNPSELKSGMPPSLDLLVALWRTEQPGRAADELSNITTTKLGLRPRRNQQQPAASASAAPTPLIHIPQCRLEITSGDELLPIGASSASFSGGMLERVALPKSLVQPFLSRLPLPHGVSAGAPHFDDDDEWVYSRCLLSDFTEMGEEGAAVLSQQGRLCCWASVVLMRYAVDGGGHDNTEAHWDLGFIVHRVLTRRDPDTTLCPCVLGE